MAINIEILLRFFLSFIVSSLTSMIIIRFIIKSEKKKHLGQAIREDIVMTHQKKQGTPTMGGLGVVGGAIVGTLINYQYLSYKILIALALIISFCLIGFIDDYKKIKYKDAKGLSASLRFSLEVILSIIALILLNYDDKTMWILHLANNYIYLGPLFVVLIIFMIVGATNAVNMTDGLDGLAGGLLILAYLPFLLMALKTKEYGIAFLITSFIGGNIGFLKYNGHPAQIFMGDAGSLANGCFIALIAFMLNSEYLLVISGLVFIVETLSVIIQVAYYKLTKKRVFKMAPLHHHFELCGLKEYQVVNMFYLVGFIMSFIAMIVGDLL